MYVIITAITAFEKDFADVDGACKAVSGFIVNQSTIKSRLHLPYFLPRRELERVAKVLSSDAKILDNHLQTLNTIRSIVKREDDALVSISQAEKQARKVLATCCIDELKKDQASLERINEVYNAEYITKLIYDLKFHQF